MVFNMSLVRVKQQEFDNLWEKHKSANFRGVCCFFSIPTFFGLLDIKTGTTNGDSMCIDVIPRHYDECKVLIGDRMRSTNS